MMSGLPVAFLHSRAFRADASAIIGITDADRRCADVDDMATDAYLTQSNGVVSA